jgi:hypothetical protein
LSKEVLVKAKDLIRSGPGLAGSLLLITIGIVGIRGDPGSANVIVALLFVIGGFCLLFRVSYRLIKKLGPKNR